MRGVDGARKAGRLEAEEALRGGLRGRQDLSCHRPPCGAKMFSVSGEPVGQRRRSNRGRLALGYASRGIANIEAWLSEPSVARISLARS
jgi:hypothetical protein